MPRITLWVAEEDKVLIDRLKVSDTSVSKLLRDALRFHFADAGSDREALHHIARIVEARLNREVNQ